MPFCSLTFSSVPEEEEASLLSVSREEALKRVEGPFLPRPFCLRHAGGRAPLLLLLRPFCSSRNRKIKKEPRRSLPWSSAVSSASSAVRPRRRSGRRGRWTGRGKRRPRRRAAAVVEEASAAEEEEEEVELTVKHGCRRNLPRLWRSHCTFLRSATCPVVSQRLKRPLSWIKGPMRCSSRSESSRRASRFGASLSNILVRARCSHKRWGEKN